MYGLDAVCGIVYKQLWYDLILLGGLFQYMVNHMNDRLQSQAFLQLRITACDILVTMLAHDEAMQLTFNQDSKLFISTFLGEYFEENFFWANSIAMYLFYRLVEKWRRSSIESYCSSFNGQSMLFKGEFKKSDWRLCARVCSRHWSTDFYFTLSKMHFSHFTDW